MNHFLDRLHEKVWSVQTPFWYVKSSVLTLNGKIASANFLMFFWNFLAIYFQQKHFFSFLNPALVLVKKYMTTSVVRTSQSIISAISSQSFCPESYNEFAKNLKNSLEKSRLLSKQSFFNWQWNWWNNVFALGLDSHTRCNLCMFDTM